MLFRRSPKQWLTDDLSKMNRPSSIVTTLRRRPLLILEAVAVGAVLSGLLALVLLVFDNLDSFAGNAFFVWIAAALFLGQRIHSYQDELPNKVDEDSPEAG